MSSFETKTLLVKYDYVAPDGSEIRLLSDMKGGGICHATMPAFAVSAAVSHKTVEEIWYFIQGCGEIWRKLNEQEEITKVAPGVCITIPPKTHFQFRNTGNEPLVFIDVTMPPWPGPEEAVRVQDYWQK